MVFVMPCLLLGLKPKCALALDFRQGEELPIVGEGTLPFSIRLVNGNVEYTLNLDKSICLAFFLNLRLRFL